MSAPHVDVLIVGAGAAGCVAAVYLRRYHRRVVLIDKGESRLAWAPGVHNVPGFPNGIEGLALHKSLREQAHRYGAPVQSGEVRSLVKRGSTFHASTTIGEIAARTVVLSTGTTLAKPNIDNLFEAVQRGIIRFCPICDGYEATGKRVGVLGGSTIAIEEAHFLRTFSSQVSYFPEHTEAVLSAESTSRAGAAGIAVFQSPVERCAVVSDGVMIRCADGSLFQVDALYAALGNAPTSRLAVSLGVACDQDGAVLVDDHCRTWIRGVYAAGDVIRGIDQIVTAFGNAAVAATALHNDLRAEDERDAKVAS